MGMRLNALKLLWKRKGSTISMVAGIVGAIGSGIMAAKAGMECKRIIDEAHADVERIEQSVGEELTKDDGTVILYDEACKEKDLVITRRKVFFGCAKAMLPAIGLGLASIAAIVYGHVTLAHQLAGTVAYASALEQQLSRAYSRAESTVGKENADIIFKNLKKETIVEETIDPETGEKTTTVEEVLRRDLDIPVDGVYEFVYDHKCRGYCNSRMYNRDQIKVAEFEANTRLTTEGKLTLDDIVEILRADHDDRKSILSDMVVGWVWTPDAKVIFEELPGDPNDPVIIFRVKTQGLIAKAVDDAKDARNGRFRQLVHKSHAA